MSDTTNKHIGNVLSELTDESLKEVFEQYAKKTGLDIYNKSWEEFLLKRIERILYAESFDYKGDIDN